MELASLDTLQFDVMKSFVILVVIFSSNLIYGQSIVNQTKFGTQLGPKWMGGNNWVSEDLTYFFTEEPIEIDGRSYLTLNQVFKSHTFTYGNCREEEDVLFQVLSSGQEVIKWISI